MLARMRLYMRAMVSSAGKFWLPTVRWVLGPSGQHNYAQLIDEETEATGSRSLS